MAENHYVPQMPPGAYRYRAEPAFVRLWNDPFKQQWYILGDKAALPVGEVIEIARFSDGETSPVVILRIIAERNVTKRDGSPTTYVLVEFDNVVEDPKTAS